MWVESIVCNISVVLGTQCTLSLAQIITKTEVDIAIHYQLMYEVADLTVELPISDPAGTTDPAEFKPCLCNVVIYRQCHTLCLDCSVAELRCVEHVPSCRLLWDRKIVLQGVSIACCAEPCISYGRDVCPSDTHTDIV